MDNKKKRFKIESTWQEHSWQNLKTLTEDFTNRNIKRLVYCRYGIWIVKSNVSSVGPSSEKNCCFSVSRYSAYAAHYVYFKIILKDFIRFFIKFKNTSKNLNRDLHSNSKTFKDFEFKEIQRLSTTDLYINRSIYK